MPNFTFLQWTTWWKARKKVFLPSWTSQPAFPSTPFSGASYLSLNSTYSGPFSDLSQECRDNLVELVGIFHNIDCTILKEVLLDQNMYKALEAQGNSSSWPREDRSHTSRFDEINLCGLRHSYIPRFL
jgi:hypothetical protein